MRIKDFGYAKVYISETLKDLQNMSDEGRFLPSGMPSDYYSEENKGAIQWNFYHLICEELVPLMNHDVIEREDSYCKKVVLRKCEIPSYLQINFPKFNPNKHGKVILILEETYRGSRIKAKKIIKERGLNVRPPYENTKKWYKADKEFRSWLRQPSIFRYWNELKATGGMDTLRKELIHNRYNMIYHTCNETEFFLMEKKFGMFNPEIIDYRK